jgi:hypothetical protein
MADVLTAVIDARGKTVFQRAAEPGGGPKW